MVRKAYPGGAEALSLSGNINSAVTTFTSSTTPTASWPTGPTPFVITMNAGSANEEKMLVASRSGTTFSSVTRGYDGTTAVAHSTGESIRAVWDAVSADEANDHTNTTSRDDHTQYMKADGTRHDLTARHTFGAALGTPAAPATPTATGSASAGSAAQPARADHLHDLPTAIPRGYLGQGADTDGQTGITSSDVDLTNVAATVTVGPGTRRLRITLSMEVQQSGSLSGITAGIWESSTTLIEHKESIVVSGETHTFMIEWVGTATAGSHTYKARMRANGGGGTTAMLASVDSPAKIVVQDIGV